MIKKILFLSATLTICVILNAQFKKGIVSKPISADLFGIFFEDINYAADGGLYAELIQNRSFEYSPADKIEWNSFTAWQFYINRGAIAYFNVESKAPLNDNNTHYLQAKIESEIGGTGIKNAGFDGINLVQNEPYIFSVFAQQLQGNVPIEVKLVNKNGVVNASAIINDLQGQWAKKTIILTPKESDTSATLILEFKGKGVINVDMVSLFPQHTFKDRANGLRKDLAQVIADLKPKFIRFPGGCLAHGNGVGNIYNWKHTIGAVEQRMSMPNIWRYHQTLGLGYFEYFQFCEDIGAKPLPVIAAGVSCQNSGHTRGIGQACVPMSDMQQYTQDILDLIEYANGDANTTWGKKRIERGHEKPFNLQYIGIGNEDKITSEFKERFKFIQKAIKEKYPNIIVIGTSGPAPDGEDFEKGWAYAKEQNVEMIDEHYYMKPEWFLANQNRYNNYNRNAGGVYLGEYASRGNTLLNALSEAAFMTSLERNGDVVKLASYAPLLAKENHTQWNPNLIYFNNTSIVPTANYYVQQMFSTNQGSYYLDGIVSGNAIDSTLATSCVFDTKTKELIIKIVNVDAGQKEVAIDLTKIGKFNVNASVIALAGKPNDKNSFTTPKTVMPINSNYKVENKFLYKMNPYSFVVLKIAQK